MAGIANPSIDWKSPALTEEWRKFQQHCELMFSGPLKKTSKEERAAYLLIWVGAEGREIFNSWTINAEQGQDYVFLFEQFRKHSAPQTNTVFSRYVFQTRNQREDELFTNYATDLRVLVKDCKYDKPDEMVRDRIVTGIKNGEIRGKLLSEGDELTMTKAIQIATSYETTQAQLKSMSSGNKLELDAIRKSSKKTQHNKQGKEEKKFLCRNCGQSHPKKQCPAFGKKCFYCEKLHHYEDFCLKKKGEKYKNKNRQVHAVEEEDDDFFIGSIDQEKQTNTAFANVQLTDGGVVDNIRFKIDTGAQANILPLKTFNKKIGSRVKLEPNKNKLVSYTGQHLNTKGQIRLKTIYKNREETLTFHVVDTEAEPILGLQACVDLQLVQLLLSVEEKQPSSMTADSVKKDYPQLFSGMGDLGEARIQLQEGAVGVIDAPRRVPLALKGRLKQELDRMQEQDVIVKVSEPTDWVSSLVVVEKPNGKLRVCLDPRNLNKAVKRPHYNMPTLEDAVAKMAGAKFFSKLDAQSGYWQIRLDEKSSYLTTFNTPFGRYRFKRLPFGVISAQDLFQQKMDEIFEDMQGVTPLIDDVIIHGTTQEEHDRNLKAALDKATDSTLRLNAEKLTVGAEEVEYFGHLITADGLKPDPKKVRAIETMPPPTNKKELQTVLGMITYLAKFAPQLSEATKPMRDLLKEDIEFVWDKPQEESLRKVKQIITEQPVLAFFDPKKHVTLQVDASKHGLGATLMQDRKPVAYASKSLNATEQNYAQIEKELFAILFGCRRFHQYIYGRKITVESDHKPLESIATKALAAAPPRLQRMLLQLQKYDIKIIHVPGKNIPVADTLSRIQAKETEVSNEDFKDIEAQVHCITSNLPINDNKMEEVRQATANDAHLCRLKHVISEGWPEHRQNCKQEMHEYWNFRDELTVIDGIIFKGTKIFIPEALRAMMLDKLHIDHLGEEKTQQRARGIFFWPGMTSDIKQKVATCKICATHRSSNQKEPMIPHEVPERQWQKIASDLFTWEKRQFMVTVDYLSRFFEIDELTSTTSAAVIRKLSAHFARQGIPEIFVSDNAAQFSSQEFEDFAREWDFEHVTPSPEYPQSNGLAEKAVQIAKKIMTKAKEDRRNPLLALLEYRCTPVDGMKSPAEILYGRQLRSILPSTSQHLQQTETDLQQIIQRRQTMQDRQKRYYDRQAKPLPPLNVRDTVYLQSKNKWQPGTIVDVADTPRSYIVKTQEGGTYRRNRRFIRKDAENTTPPVQAPEPPTAAEHHPADATPSKPSPPEQQIVTTRSGRVVRRPKAADE